jgi:hypothetical protein
MKAYKGKGKFIYLENDPGLEYYDSHLEAENDPSYINELLSAVSKQIESLIQSGRTSRLLTVKGFNAETDGYLSYDPYQERFFVDLVNFNLGEKNAIIKAPSGEVTLILPSMLRNKNLKILCYNEKTAAPENFTSFKQKDGVLTLTVPGFEVYRTYIISAK